MVVIALCISFQQQDHILILLLYRNRGTLSTVLTHERVPLLVDFKQERRCTDKLMSTSYCSWSEIYKQEAKLSLG